MICHQCKRPYQVYYHHVTALFPRSESVARDAVAPPSFDAREGPSRSTHCHTYPDSFRLTKGWNQLGICRLLHREPDPQIIHEP